MKRFVCFVLAITASVKAGYGGVDPDQIRSSIRKSIVLLQSTGKVWFDKRPCTSCHHSALPTLALMTARQHGTAIDEAMAREHFHRAYAYLTNLDPIAQGNETVGLAQGDSYALWGAEAAGLPRNTASGALAKMLASQQTVSGHWRTPDVRPPASGSLFTITALSVRVMRSYLPIAASGGQRERISRARHWLETNTPRSTEDSAFRLLGAKWSGSKATVRAEYSRQLMAEQRPDGGWAQIAARPSDAYASGQVLVALMEGAGVDVGNEAIQRGLAYLLRTQFEDGSWLVRSRIHDNPPISPKYFETGFPHGTDQIASCSGTSWATMALSLALPLGAVKPFRLDEMVPANERWTDTVLFGSIAELRKLNPNLKTAAGTTVLMLAAGEEKKAKMLLDRGADVNAVAKSGYSALMVASSYGGNVGTIRALLDRGARPDPDPGVKILLNRTALIQAVISGDLANVKELVARGGDIQRRSMVFGGYSAAPLTMAVFLDDPLTVAYLGARGAEINEADQDGVSLMERAALFGRADMVELLARLGGNPDTHDKRGMTPLIWASTIEFGNAETVGKLLAAGARVDVAGRGGVTALTQSEKYGLSEVRAALQHGGGR